MSLGYQKLDSIHGRMCATQGNPKTASLWVTLLGGLASLLSPFSGGLICVGKESLCQCYPIAKHYTQHLKYMVSLDPHKSYEVYINVSILQMRWLILRCKKLWEKMEFKHRPGWAKPHAFNHIAINLDKSRRILHKIQHLTPLYGSSEWFFNSWACHESSEKARQGIWSLFIVLWIHNGV